MVTDYRMHAHERALHQAARIEDRGIKMMMMIKEGNVRGNDKKTVQRAGNNSGVVKRTRLQVRICLKIPSRCLVILQPDRAA